MLAPKVIYKVTILEDGRFDHVYGKRAAYIRGAEMLGHHTRAAEYAAYVARGPNQDSWGVRIERLTPAQAKAVELQHNPRKLHL
jgi:hypothetical protein